MEQFLRPTGSPAVPSVVQLTRELKELTDTVADIKKQIPDHKEQKVLKETFDLLKKQIADQKEQIDDLVEQLNVEFRGLSMKDGKEEKKKAKSIATHGHFFTEHNVAQLPVMSDFKKDVIKGLIVLIVGNKTSNRSDFALALEQHFRKLQPSRPPEFVQPIVTDSGFGFEDILQFKNEGKIVLVEVESIYDTRPNLRKNVDLVCFHYPDLENEVYLKNWETWNAHKGVNINATWNNYLIAHDVLLRTILEFFNVKFVFPHGPIADKIKSHTYLCWNPQTEHEVDI